MVQQYYEWYVTLIGKNQDNINVPLLGNYYG